MIESHREKSNLWDNESADLWIWKSRNQLELWLEEESRESLIKSITYNEWYYWSIYDMIKYYNVFPNNERLDFIKRYSSKHLEKFTSQRLMWLYWLRYDQWEIWEANRIKRYILATYPDYEPAKLIDRKEVIDRYVVHRLRFDDKQLIRTEAELIDDFGLDADTNIVLATQRLDSGDEWQALRYGQIAQSNIDLHVIQQYLIIFLGYLEQDRVWDLYDARETQIDQDAQEAYEARRDLYLTGSNYLSGDAIYSWDVLVQNLTYTPKVSELNRAYLKRRLADQTDRNEFKSQTAFEIEAMRGQYESLMDEDMFPLFQRAFARYYNFRDKYFKEPEVEDDDLEDK